MKRYEYGFVEDKGSRSLELIENPRGSVVRFEDVETLEAQVVALISENLEMKSAVKKSKEIIMQSVFEYWTDRCELLSAVQLIEHSNTPTDAIKRQWMAEGAKEGALRIRTCAEEFPEASRDIVEECAILAESQPEEKVND